MATSDEPLGRFAEELANEVDEAVSDESPFSAISFTRVVLERLEEAGHLDGAFFLHQEGRLGNAAYRIDGYTFDDERQVLELFTTIYRGELPPVRIPAVDVAKAAERALRFATACVDGLADRLEPSNTDATDLARRVERGAADLKSVRIVILTDGIITGTLPNSGKWRHCSIEHDAYDIVRLQRVLGEGETRSDITVDLVALTGGPVPCLHVPSHDGSYETYLTVLPGEVLSQIYERYGVRLLELNVRAFLGLQGRKSVNAELRRTILEQPARFLAYNNGIVATVDSIDVNPSANGTIAIRTLRGLQIVNGGQTTASLHRARRKDGISLQRVTVPLKIIRVGGADLTEMVGSVSRAANRQNAVQLADFSSNDPLHHQIETLANNTWLDDGRGRWFYERARGSYVAAEQKASYRKIEQQNFRVQTPKQRRISKLDVGRYLNAWGCLPHRVCLGGQKNFQFFMQRLKDGPPHVPDTAWFKRLVAIAILYRAAARIVRVMTFPAYGAQIVAYTVAAISHRTGGRIDFGLIWSRQSVSAELEALIKAWAILLDSALRQSAGQRNPSEWFKKEECWSEIVEHLPAVTEPLPDELSFDAPNVGTADVRRATLSAEDYERVAECMTIDPSTWLEVAERGQQSGVLHWRLAGICRTLASYAAGGWCKKPSPRQALHALKSFHAAKDAGLLQRSDR